MQRETLRMCRLTSWSLFRWTERQRSLLFCLIRTADEAEQKCNYFLFERLLCPCLSKMAKAQGSICNILNSKCNFPDFTACRPLIGTKMLLTNPRHFWMWMDAAFLFAKTWKSINCSCSYKRQSRNHVDVLPVIAPDTWTIVWVPSRYTVSMLCSEGRGSVVVASTLGLRMVNMYGWTSREKLRVCFFSIPLRSAIEK